MAVTPTSGPEARMHDLPDRRRRLTARGLTGLGALAVAAGVVAASAGLAPVVGAVDAVACPSGAVRLNAGGCAASASGETSYLIAVPGDAGELPEVAALRSSGAKVETVAVQAGEPGQPASVKTERKDGKVMATWTAPADDGGLPIVGYRVILLADNDDVLNASWVKAGTLSAELDDSEAARKLGVQALGLGSADPTQPRSAASADMRAKANIVTLGAPPGSAPVVDLTTTAPSTTTTAPAPTVTVPPTTASTAPVPPSSEVGRRPVIPDGGSAKISFDSSGAVAVSWAIPGGGAGLQCRAVISSGGRAVGDKTVGCEAGGVSLTLSGAPRQIQGTVTVTDPATGASADIPAGTATLAAAPAAPPEFEPLAYHPSGVLAAPAQASGSVNPTQAGSQLERFAPTGGHIVLTVAPVDSVLGRATSAASAGLSPEYKDDRQESAVGTLQASARAPSATNAAALQADLVAAGLALPGTAAATTGSTTSSGGTPVLLFAVALVILVFVACVAVFVVASQRRRRPDLAVAAAGSAPPPAPPVSAGPPPGPGPAGAAATVAPVTMAPTTLPHGPDTDEVAEFWTAPPDTLSVPAPIEPPPGATLPGQEPVETAGGDVLDGQEPLR